MPMSWSGRLLVTKLSYLLLIFCPLAQAETAWFDPHPMRLEAITEGRLFTYNSESFLHRFSYRNLSSDVKPGADGLWGTGGSITGDQLYVEINAQKTLRFDNERYAIVTRTQRREDYDGRFDRQMVGISRRFGDSWEGTFIADITGDKGLVDFQLESTWQPDDRRQLRLAMMQPDRLYNNKSDSGNKYQKSPTTVFAHYSHQGKEYSGFEAAINFTPRARYEDRSALYVVDAEQLRVAGDLTLPLTGQWYGNARLEVENSRRDFSGRGVPGNDFSRNSRHMALALMAPDRPWSPSAGLRYFELDESGWFGEGLAASGHNTRRELGAFAGIRWRSGESHWVEPGILLMHVDLDRRLMGSPERDRNTRDVVGKVIVPWRYVIHQQSGAVVSINPTFRLHRFAFGGGNIQLHWPF